MFFIADNCLLIETSESGHVMMIRINVITFEVSTSGETDYRRDSFSARHVMHHQIHYPLHRHLNIHEYVSLRPN